MAKKITRKDIFSEENVFKGVIASANDMLKKLGAIDSALKKTAQNMKSSFNVKFNSTQAIKDFTKAVEKANALHIQAQKVAQARQKTEETLAKTIKAQAQAEQAKQKAEASALQTKKEKLRVSQEEEKLARQKIATDKAQSVESARLAKEQAKQKKIAEDNASAYKQLERSTRDLKNQSKELGAQMLKLESDGKKNTSAYRQLEQQYKRVTAEAQKGDAQLKKLDKTVGDNFRNVGNYESALGKLNGVLATFGASFGIAQVFDSAKTAVMGYEQANATLSAVLGTTTDKTKDLQNIQRELGKTSGFTATQVGELQIELARLGFTETQIKSATNSVLQLAKASGSDLGRASEVAGATLRGFGLEAYETARVSDVMAKSFDISALGMENFAEAMKYVAPVAKSAGVSLEETTAMLGVLSNVGISGSQAGTSLRQIFSQLSGEGKTLSEALADLSEEGLNLASAEDEVGRNAKTALLALTANTKGIEDMNMQLNNATGSALKTATTMGDTLGGSLNRLRGAFEGYILDTNESSGASESLREAIDFLTENLVTILNTVVYLAEMWLKYKVIVLAQIGYNKLMASSFMQSATSMKGLSGVVTGLKGAFQSLGQAIKQNIAGIALMVVYELYNRFSKLNDAMTRAVKVHEEIAVEQKKVAQNTATEKKEIDALFKALKETNKGSVERRNLIDEINSRYGTTLENLDDEKLFVIEVDNAYKDLMETLKEKSALEGKRIAFEVSQKSLSEVEMELRGMENKLKGFGNDVGLIFGVDMSKKSGTAPRVTKGFVGETGASKLVGGLISSLFGVEDVDQVIEQYNALGKSYAQLLKDANKYETEYNNAQATAIKKRKITKKKTIVTTDGGGSTGGGGGTTTAPSVSEYESELIILDKYDNKIRQLTQDLKILDDEFSKVDLIQDIDVEVSAKVKYSEEQLRKGLDPFADIVEGEMYDEVERNIIKRFDILREVEKQNTEFNKETLRLNYKKIYEDELKQIEEAYTQAKETYNKEREDLRKAIAKGEESPVSLVNLDKAFKGTTDSYNKAKDQLAENEKTRQIDLNKEIEIEEKNSKQRLGELDKEQNDKINEYNDKRIQKVEEVNAEIVENNKDTNDKLAKDNEAELDKYRERWENIANVVKEVTEFFIAQSDKRIQKIDEEIARAKENYENYKELAKAGNINAQQSLEEQNKIIAQATKKREAEERRQARLKLISSAFETYSNNVSKLKTNEPTSKALTQTITDITLLSKIVQNLPIFEKGTEDTGVNGRGVDGRGGFHAILHPRERVLTKEQNAPLVKAGISNEELSRIATDYKEGKLLNIAPVQTNTDLGVLVDKIENLTKVIESKPEVNVGVGEITQSLVEIVQKEKRANTVTYNRYRVKK
jgi:DNA repair exonuclease SbcCD ATPase subunit